MNEKDAILPSTADLAVNGLEIEQTNTDPYAEMRQRIEQEELEKYQEEKIRAEIRGRLSAEKTPVLTPEVQNPTSTSATPIIVNVTNTASAVATVTVQTGRTHPSTIVRAIYFVVIGWWLGFVWIGVAALLCASVIGLPVGLLMFSRTTEAFIL